MVKFITTHSGPSNLTISLIALVNQLNASGTKAELYGESQWPNAFCEHYHSLSEFKIESVDTIVNVGFRIESIFDLINLDRYRYVHGRKNKVLLWIKFYVKFLKSVIPAFLVRRFLLKEISPHHTRSFYTRDLTLVDKFDLSHLLNEEFYKKNTEDPICRADIEKSSEVLDFIKNHQGQNIKFESAIIDPIFFKEHLLPLIRKGQLIFTGFQAWQNPLILCKSDLASYIRQWPPILK